MDSTETGEAFLVFKEAIAGSEDVSQSSPIDGACLSMFLVGRLSRAAKACFVHYHDGDCHYLVRLERLRQVGTLINRLIRITDPKRYRGN